MQKIIFGVLVFFLVSCGAGKTEIEKRDAIKEKYASEIKTEDLKEHLFLLSSDILEGRKTGEKRQKMAVNYMTAFYDHNGLLAPKNYPEYTQEIEKEFFDGKSKGPSSNVLAYIEGSEFPNEVIIITAHYDHLGMSNDEVYNGADDNASGTSAVMELAQSFQLAKKQGKGPRRSILFLHLTGEEIGLFGSQYYIENPVYSLDSTVVNLNIDMVGRVDEKHINQREYIYLIGSDRLSKDLHKLAQETNKKYTQLKLDYTYNQHDDPNNYYERSDHFNFAQMNIPVIFFFNGSHSDYHRISDTADKIDFELLALRTKFIFYTAWEIANRDERIEADKK
ncbi:M28 family peptidase [Lutimonas zeaxanthinifaciens]|uniref:M28 family peptidase n=1 Tax=Lutimonas zeaxanthinifaciens TaxID=3060215 RepID=UPI00265D557E|nr:M28 family peptidase [Lutimonas sp. YSD2104]WKK67245.1 M28 family peptidase [Lutimonas sp. YSD2104]